MTYIIDTHIFLWLLFEPEKLSNTTLQILKNPKTKVAITTISFMEISLKYALGKLELHGIIPDELPALSEKLKINIVQIGAGDMASFYRLPKAKKHRDPFDRIIIWYCIRSGATLVSHDRKFGFYEGEGLKVLELRGQ